MYTKSANLNFCSIPENPVDTYCKHLRGQELPKLPKRNEEALAVLHPSGPQSFKRGPVLQYRQATGQACQFGKEGQKPFPETPDQERVIWPIIH